MTRDIRGTIPVPQAVQEGEGEVRERGSQSPPGGGPKGDLYPPCPAPERAAGAHGCPQNTTLTSRA